MSQARRLKTEGFQEVQNWRTSCAAARSKARDTASLKEEFQERAKPHDGEKKLVVYTLKEPMIDEQGWMGRQEWTCNGVLGRHFAEQEGDVDAGADDGIANEHAGWAALCERLISTKKEPGRMVK